MASSGSRAMPTASGVGLRLPHLTDVVATRPSASWFEIHPENFLANPHAAELLADIARDYPVSVHSVGVSIGSASGIDRPHLARVRALVDRIDPIFVSGHLAWSTHAGEYLNDLLPLPYTKETLRIVSAHVDEVQDALGRQYLVENPSSYVGFSTSTMTEVEFLSELVHRTGCRLLCDVSNIYLSAHNLGFDRDRYLAELPAEAIAELHLGGFTPEPEDGGEVLIDTHGSRIAEPVWTFYARALEHFGPKPTLIEWDNDVPALGVIQAEAAHADAVSQSTFATRSDYALAS
jgi:uncharacterized protein (UPF0276 family)